MLREMIDCFLGETRTLFPQIRAALQKGDLAEVGRLAHRLKGTIVHLGAEPATEAAARVERFGRPGGRQAEAEASVRAMERECHALEAACAERRSNRCPRKQ
jgi:HPt (histidine-containing phosphotransfer) domain-containing protein